MRRQMLLNRVMIGNLGEDPEIRYTPGGLPLMKFSLATEVVPGKRGETAGASPLAYRGGREARIVAESDIPF